jgi:hypothetical protein
VDTMDRIQVEEIDLILQAEAERTNATTGHPVHG